MTWNQTPRTRTTCIADLVQTGMFGLRCQEDCPTPTSHTFSILADDDDDGDDMVRELKGWAHKTVVGKKSQKMRRVRNEKHLQVLGRRL